MKNSTAFILLLVSVGLFYTFISPHYEKVDVLKKQSDQYKNILGNVAELTKIRQDLDVKYQNTPATEIARLEKIVPDNVDTVNLAMNFDAIAARYGISIKSIRTVDNKDDAGTSIMQSGQQKSYDTVTVSFSFITTYQNFRKFMQDVEQSLRIIDVKSLAFKTSESGIYEFQITIETYWLK
ncbi:type 4a pilus biogenesis protein PilO [Candidatus Parcubacteria bacterium]|nr:type 4a pilus biogenesis protein PilO [Candidatus Parcubacteria bacterium]